MKRYLKYFLAIPLILAVAYFFQFGIDVVSGESMEPTFYNGDIVYVDLLGLDADLLPKIGDVIIFSFSSESRQNINSDITLVKRVIEIDREKKCLWVEGDNKDFSIDSRIFGWVCEFDLDRLPIVVKKLPEWMQ